MDEVIRSTSIIMQNFHFTWADYRTHHLRPEVSDHKKMKFLYANCTLLAYDVLVSSAPNLCEDNETRNPRENSCSLSLRVYV